MSEINQLLEALNSISLKNSISVYIPSLKRTALFKPITVAQQKSLLDCGYDNIIFHTKFIITTYNIIQENCLEPDITKDLTIIDRVSILLAYRRNIFGNFINTQYGEMDITPFFEKVQSLTLEEETIEVDNIKLELQIPKMVDQYTWEKELRFDFEKQAAIAEKIVQALGDLLVGELGKSVKEIYLNGTSINYSTMTPSQKTEVINKLPMTISNKITDFVSKLTNTQLELLTVTKNEENSAYSTTIDVSLNTLTVK